MIRLMEVLLSQTEMADPVEEAAAAVQAALAPAIAAAVQAGAAAAGTAGGSSRGALDAEALAEALGSQLSLALQPVVAGLKEVTQALRSTEGQVVRAVQGCHATLLEVLQDSVALHREDQDRLYNAAAAAHNKAVFLMHRRVIFWNPSIARWHLLPLKNAHGELPPAGLFPSTGKEAEDLLSSVYDSHTDVQWPYHSRIYKLLVFYRLVDSDGNQWPASAEAQSPEDHAQRLSALARMLGL